MNNEQLPVYPVTIDLLSEEGYDMGERKTYGLSKLEAFTMAAMEGLCANPNVTTVFPGIDKIMFAQNLEHAAVHIARATLSILQNEQK